MECTRHSTNLSSRISSRIFPTFSHHCFIMDQRNTFDTVAGSLLAASGLDPEGPPPPPEMPRLRSLCERHGINPERVGTLSQFFGLTPDVEKQLLADHWVTEALLFHCAVFLGDRFEPPPTGDGSEQRVITLSTFMRDVAEGDQHNTSIFVNWAGQLALQWRPIAIRACLGTVSVFWFFSP